MLLTDDDYPRSLNIQTFQPSEDWARGGPIIEREKITPHADTDEWIAQAWGPGNFNQAGPTPLIAAMRCFVASKLGPEVEIPNELASPKLNKGMTP